MTKRLAIVAHFDIDGHAAPHVLRQLDVLSRSFDSIVVTTTSALTPDARSALSARADLIERPNFGQDFASWRDGLSAVKQGKGFDTVLLTNDSYICTVDSWEPALAAMADRPVEAWGLTKTWRHAEHIQSYFLCFTRPVLASQGFARFWADFRPAPNRTAAITTQEVGISRALRSSGFRLGSYFEPSRQERLLANRRGVHWLIRRRRTYPARFHGFGDHFHMRRFRDPLEANNLNWASVFADFVFDRDRFPAVKIDTLRYDPLWLGSEELLTRSEERFPEAFAGVRDYIQRTTTAYPPRPFESPGPAHLNAIERRVVGYRVQGGHAAGKRA